MRSNGRLNHLSKRLKRLQDNRAALEVSPILVVRQSLEDPNLFVCDGDTYTADELKQLAATGQNYVIRIMYEQNWRGA